MKEFFKEGKLFGLQKKTVHISEERDFQAARKVVSDEAGLRGNERDGMSSSDGGLKLDKRETAFLRKRGRGEVQNEDLEYELSATNLFH